MSKKGIDFVAAEFEHELNLRKMDGHNLILLEEIRVVVLHGTVIFQRYIKEEATIDIENRLVLYRVRLGDAEFDAVLKALHGCRLTKQPFRITVIEVPGMIEVRLSDKIQPTQRVGELSYIE